MFENAILGSNINKIKSHAEAGDPKFIILKKYSKYNTKNICTLQTWIVFLSILSGITIINILKISAFEMETPLVYIIGMLFFLFLQTVFGIIIPRVIAINNPENIAYRFRPIISLLRIVSKPFVFLESFFARTILKLLGIDPKQADSVITEEEIRQMVDTGGKTGSIDENEQEMINNIFEFDNTSVDEIATHRTDIVAIPLSSTFDEVKEVMRESKFSRFPVYNETIDDIVGILHIKDFARYLFDKDEETARKEFDLLKLCKTPYFIPSSKKTDELLEEMQKQKVYLSVVIDEYGGTVGIVTMEDLLEEIVGNIFDEYDALEEEDVSVVKEDVYKIKGATDLDEVSEILGIDFSEYEDEYDTIGGFLIGQIGRIPEDGEQPKVSFGGYTFNVDVFSEKRIEEITAVKETKKEIKEEPKEEITED